MVEKNINERLKIYKRALFDYQLSRFFGSFFFNTEFGLCWYLRNFSSFITIYDLPELLEAKRNLEIRDDIYGYWFKTGLLKPRIELLKETIELTEKKILDIQRANSLVE